MGITHTDVPVSEKQVIIIKAEDMRSAGELSLSLVNYVDKGELKIHLVLMPGAARRFVV